MLYASDLITQYIPWYYLAAQSLHRLSLPHWIDSIYGTGYPLLAQGETGVLSPINASILFIFPFTVAVTILYVTYLTIAATGTYLFLKQNKLNKLSSTLGALVFCLSGFIISRYFQPSIVFTSALLPWGFYLIQKSQNTPKFIPLIAALIYLQITAGHLQIAFISVCGYITFSALILAGNKKWKLKFLKLLFAVALGVSLSAIQIIPSLKLYGLSKRADFDPMVRFSYSLPPSHLLTYIKPFEYGISKPGDDLGFRQFGGGFWEVNITIWTIPFLLSLVPLIAILKNPRAWVKENKLAVILYSIWLIFLLVSLGGFFKPYQITAHIPNFPFRAPARFMAVATLAASAVAAIGFEKLTSNLSQVKRTVAFLLVIISVVFQMNPFFRGYFILENDRLVVDRLSQIVTYKMTTPLEIDTGKSRFISEEAFRKPFNYGSVVSLISLAILIAWYRREKVRLN